MNCKIFHLYLDKLDTRRLDKLDTRRLDKLDTRRLDKLDTSHLDRFEASQLNRFEGSQLDGIESPWALPPEMQAHVNICEACHRHFQLYQQTLAILENDAAPNLPADFSAKILARLEPTLAPAPTAIFNWKRIFVYAGYAFALGLALWFGFKNFDLSAAQKFLHSPAAQQIQQWLAATGATETLQAFQRFVTNVLSLIPISGSFIEKMFGTEALPRAFNLTLMLLLTFTVAKASVFLEGWVRQISRRP